MEPAAHAARPAQPPSRPPALPPTPDDEPRRERALLLRAFETSTLTKSNFCVLKRIGEAELDAALAQARQEREQRAREAPPERAAVPRHERSPEPRGPQGPRPPHGARPPRRPR